MGIEPMLADDGTEDNKEKKKTTTTTTDTTQPVPTRAPREADVRRFRINQTLLEKYGYTTGCDGCEHKLFQSTGGHRGHNEECRSRIRNEMLKDDNEKTRLLKQEERMAKKPDKSET